MLKFDSCMQNWTGPQQLIHANHYSHWVNSLQPGKTPYGELSSHPWNYHTVHFNIFPFQNFHTLMGQWKRDIFNALELNILALTHCYILMEHPINSLKPSDDICSVTGHGQHWFMEWLVAWQHQAITWTSNDLSSGRNFGIHLKVISYQMLKVSDCNMCLEITLLKLLPYLLI